MKLDEKYEQWLAPNDKGFSLLQRESHGMASWWLGWSEGPNNQGTAVDIRSAEKAARIEFERRYPGASPKCNTRQCTWKHELADEEQFQLIVWRDVPAGEAPITWYARLHRGPGARPHEWAMKQECMGHVATWEEGIEKSLAALKALVATPTPLQAP